MTTLNAKANDIKQEGMIKALAKEGKYLTFALANEEYGVEILSVREIIGIMNITAVVQVPDYLKGVINLRGRVIPVVDLRIKFGLESVPYTEQTCIIVINVDDTLMGIVVDNVCEVLDIDAKDIEPTPDFGSMLATEFILGMGKIDDSVKMLLAIDKVLKADTVLADKLAD